MAHDPDIKLKSKIKIFKDGTGNSQRFADAIGQTIKIHVMT